MIQIGVVVGSTRPGRKADAVARWVVELARERGDAEVELVDLADYDLPLLDEPTPPSLGQYTKEHTVTVAASWRAAAPERGRFFDRFGSVRTSTRHDLPRFAEVGPKPSLRRGGRPGFGRLRV